MSRLRRLAIALAGALLALSAAAVTARADVPPGSGNGTSTHKQAPHPKLTLSQFQHLQDGEEIIVTGTGFCPNNGDTTCQPVYGIEECTAPVNGSQDCDSETLKSPQHNPGRDDSSGNFQLQVFVVATITLPSGQVVHCNATGSCAVGASNFENTPDFTPSAYEAVGFGGSAATSAASANPTSAATSQPAATAQQSAAASSVPSSSASASAAAPAAVTPTSTGLSGGTQLEIGLAGVGIILIGGLAGWLVTGWLRKRPS